MRQFFSHSARGGSDDIDKYRDREKEREKRRERRRRERDIHIKRWHIYGSADFCAFCSLPLLH